MEIQSTRLWTLLALIVTECCLVAVLVSMETVTVTGGNSTVTNNTAGNVAKLCWNWGVDSDGEDCPVDMLFSQIIFTALGVVVCLVPAVLHCLRQGNILYRNTCDGCEVLSFFLPLFFSVISAALGIAFIGVVVEDHRDNPSLPGIVDLSNEMIVVKPWRIALTGLACIQVIIACVFAGILAAKWRVHLPESTGHLQSRPLMRQRKPGRNNLKSALFVADL